MQTTTEVVHITFDVLHPVVTVKSKVIIRKKRTIMVSCTTL